MVDIGLWCGSDQLHGVTLIFVSVFLFVSPFLLLSLSHSLCVAVCQSGETVLIGAVRGGHVEIVRALLNKYADIDVRGQVGAPLPLSLLFY